MVKRVSEVFAIGAIRLSKGREIGCYQVEIVISYKGQMTMKLLEY